MSVTPTKVWKSTRKKAKFRKRIFEGKHMVLILVLKDNEKSSGIATMPYIQR